MQKLARITASNKDCMNVFWTPDRRIRIQYVGRLHDLWKSEDLWYEEADGNIINTVATYLGCLPHVIYADQFMVFSTIDGRQHGKAYDLVRDIYDCEWSDFACDNLVIHFNVRTIPTLYDKYERLAMAIECDRCYEPDRADIQRTAAALRAAVSDRSEELYEPRSPTCGYCSGDGQLMFIRDEFRCGDCGGIYEEKKTDNDFIPLPSADAPWPMPIRPTPVLPTLRQEWIRRRFHS